MSRLGFFIFAASLLLALSFAGNRVSGQSQEKHGWSHQSDRGYAHNTPMLPRKVKRMLNLTPEQSDRIKEIRESHTQSEQAINERMCAAGTKLEQVLMSGQADTAQLDASKSELAAARTDLINLHAEILAQIRDILTEQQSAKLAKLDGNEPLNGFRLQKQLFDPETQYLGFMNLSPEQQSHIQELNQKHKSEILSARNTTREAQNALGRAVLTRQPEKVIGQYKKEYAGARARLMDLTVEDFANMVKTLTPEQLSSYKEHSRRNTDFGGFEIEKCGRFSF